MLNEDGIEICPTCKYVGSEDEMDLNLHMADENPHVFHHTTKTKRYCGVHHVGYYGNCEGCNTNRTNSLLEQLIAIMSPVPPPPPPTHSHV